MAQHLIPFTSSDACTRRRALKWTVVVGIGLAVATAARADADEDAVSIDTARAEHIAGRAILIDIREPQEHATGVAAGARLLPSSQLGARWTEIPTDPSKPVFLICGTQNRSRAALRALRERGRYAHVRYVSGGMTGWTQRGLPLVKPAP